MGTVMTTFQCDNCGEEATEDFNYKTHEVHIFCPMCGMFRDTCLVREEDDITPRRDKDGDFEYSHNECKKPYALLVIEFEIGVRHLITMENKGQFLHSKDKFIRDYTEESKITRAFFRRFHNGTFSVKKLLEKGRLYNPKFSQ